MSFQTQNTSYNGHTSGVARAAEDSLNHKMAAMSSKDDLMDQDFTSDINGVKYYAGSYVHKNHEKMAKTWKTHQETSNMAHKSQSLQIRDSAVNVDSNSHPSVMHLWDSINSTDNMKFGDEHKYNIEHSDVPSTHDSTVNTNQLQNIKDTQEYKAVRNLNQKINFSTYNSNSKFKNSLETHSSKLDIKNWDSAGNTSTTASRSFLPLLKKDIKNPNLKSSDSMNSHLVPEESFEPSRNNYEDVSPSFYTKNDEIALDDTRIDGRSISQKIVRRIATFTSTDRNANIPQLSKRVNANSSKYSYKKVSLDDLTTNYVHHSPMKLDNDSETNNTISGDYRMRQEPSNKPTFLKSVLKLKKTNKPIPGELKPLSEQLKDAHKQYNYNKNFVETNLDITQSLDSKSLKYLNEKHNQGSYNITVKSTQPAGIKDGNQEKVLKSDSLKLPLTPEITLKYYGRLLTEYEEKEILTFKEIYFAGTSSIEKIGSERRKTGADLGRAYNVVGSIQGAETKEALLKAKDKLDNNYKPDIDMDVYNNGFDDSRGDYYLTKNDHINYRYEILSLLGKGSFGQVVKCYDHKTKSNVAVKIVRNKQRFEKQGKIEVKVLVNLKKNDLSNKYSLVHALDSFNFRGHLCISFEILGCNLYEWIKLGKFEGINTVVVRYIAAQVLNCLLLLYKCKTIHCDLKPENILLVDRTIKSPGKHCLKGTPAMTIEQLSKYKIKVIDFGSSCLESEQIYTYVQSRFYRSPEVMLGMPYSMSVDMWSFGCILAELYTGCPLFPGENEIQQMMCIMKIRGLPSNDLINRGTRKAVFFNEDSSPILEANSKGVITTPGSSNLCKVLKTKDFIFVDFLEKCLEWDPEKRITPAQAINHPFISQGLLKLTNNVNKKNSLLPSSNAFSASTVKLNSNVNNNLPKGKF